MIKLAHYLGQLRQIRAEAREEGRLLKGIGFTGNIVGDWYPSAFSILKGKADVFGEKDRRRLAIYMTMIRRMTGPRMWRVVSRVVV